MRPGLSRALTCFALVLALVPLVPGKGLPAQLKADEPAYFLMALSLAHDGDLRCDLEDVGRLFDHFPFAPVRNLILGSDDGWHTAYFAKPFLYSLVAAPFAALFGADGMVFLNMLLLLAMVGMGMAYLRRYNPPGVAALFSGGFFLLSAACAYVFWLHPEVFNMAAVTAAFFLGHRGEKPPEGGDDPALDAPRHTLLIAAASGGALSLAVYNKPMLAAFALPLLYLPLRRRAWKEASAWLLGAAATLGAAAALSVALTGHPTAYLGAERSGVTVCDPDHLPFTPTPPPPPALPGSAQAPPQSAPTNSWWWILRSPRLDFGQLRRDLGYFFWGRHTGLLPYLPFAGLALLCFLLHGRRSAVRWWTVAALAVVALFFLVFIPFNWHGGGGFVGNRYFVNAYPAFLFLVTRIRPAWLLGAAYAAGGVLLGPLLLTPWGAPVPEPTLQAHVRNFPYPLLPFELELRNVPGYTNSRWGEVRVVARSDATLPHGNELWLRGAERVEVWLSTGRPLERPVFAVRNVTPGNRIELELGGSAEALDYGENVPEGETRRVELAPVAPARTHREGDLEVYEYRLLVSSRSGRLRTWTRRSPPQQCAAFAYNATTEDTFYLGAAVTYLGSREELGRDVYAVGWGACRVPERLAAGEEREVETVVVNRSQAPWGGSGTARVQLAYHWLDAAGAVVDWEGIRTPLPGEVAPGEQVTVRQRIRAPAVPGRYTLELDPVLEGVAWFSRQNGGLTYRAPVEVVGVSGVGEGSPGGGHGADPG